MSSKQIHAIREIVIADAVRGHTVNVEDCYRLLHTMCPDLSRKEFEDVVLQAVADAGGTALWGGATPRSDGVDRSVQDPSIESKRHCDP